MKLLDLIQRTSNPEPWSEGDNIPWNDPDFSKRMLKEHLSQDHDAASRKFERIDQHIQWIHHHALGEKTGKILDLGCGPGLYANRLAKLGHQCVGIDYSPASIAYAKETAQEENNVCRFIKGDIRQVKYGDGYDAAMLIFGELNIFRPSDAQLILTKIHQALKPGGALILEPHTYEILEILGKKSPSWYSQESSVFSEKPHLVLEEYFWDSTRQTTTNRYFIVDATTGTVVRYARSLQAYTESQYQELLEACGYENIRFYPSLIGTPDPGQKALIAVLAQKGQP
jgi:ubiquinone/menaquinone biosynthesis C-methylase UbiE